MAWFDIQQNNDKDNLPLLCNPKFTNFLVILLCCKALWTWIKLSYKVIALLTYKPCVVLDINYQFFLFVLHTVHLYKCQVFQNSRGENIWSILNWKLDTSGKWRKQRKLLANVISLNDGSSEKVKVYLRCSFKSILVEILI